MAAQLGFSETVFVDDAATRRVRIFTPAVELPFAGHPLVGTAWLLRASGSPVDTLRPPGRRASPRGVEGERASWPAGPSGSARFELLELGSRRARSTRSRARPTADDLRLLAFASTGDGQVRARVFPRRLGIDEDEATGSAAVLLAALLGRGTRDPPGRRLA